MINPVNGRVVVRQLDTPLETPGGILLPENRDDTDPCILVEVVKSSDQQFSASDTVIINRYPSSNINVDGEEYIIVKSEDILGTV